MNMKRTEKKNNENNTSYLTRSIKWVLVVAVLVVCSVFLYKSGASLLWVAGVYVLVRSVFKIIRLSICIIYSVLSVFFLLAVVAIILSFIL